MAENVNKSTSTKSFEGKGTPMGEIRVASHGKADTDTGDSVKVTPAGKK